MTDAQLSEVRDHMLSALLANDGEAFLDWCEALGEMHR